MKTPLAQYSAGGSNALPRRLAVRARAGRNPNNRGTGLFEQTDVFVAGQDGISQFRIPVLLTSTSGTLLAFCDARVEKPGDPPNNIDLVMKRSTDQGRTWGPLQVVAGCRRGRHRRFLRAGGPADGHDLGLHRLLSGGCRHPHGQAGTVGGHLHVLGHQEHRRRPDLVGQNRPHAACSRKPEWNSGSPGPGKGMQMRSGRLVVPKYFVKDGYAASHVVFSDDHGESWKIGGEAYTNGTTNESQVAELSDGTLLAEHAWDQGEPAEDQQEHRRWDELVGGHAWIRLWSSRAARPASRTSPTGWTTTGTGSSFPTRPPWSAGT